MRTFNFVVLAILGLFFASCGDDDDRLGDWEKSIQFGGAPREGSVCFKYVDESTKEETVFVGFGFGSKQEEYADMYQFNGNVWEEIKFAEGEGFPANPNPGSMPNGNGRHAAVAFVIGEWAYVGTGYISTLINSTTNRERTFFNDFYRFNMKTKKWDQEWSITLPAEGRRDAVAFSDGKYGYVGTGYGDNDRVYKDFYKFAPDANGGKGGWEDISFSGDARYGAVAFVVNNAAYVCLGSSSVGQASTYVLDVTKYDFATGNWTKMGSLADKPGVKQDKDYGRIPRTYAISFVSNQGKNNEEYAYVAIGGGSNSRTVWKYNHKKDQWHQMEDISRLANITYMGVGFSFGGYGYYTTGGSNIDGGSPTMFIDTWRFIPDVKETRRNDY